MTLPTFLGIGAPRAGTTWLNTLLSSHPDVYMPTRREEVRFFDRDYDFGLGWYESFFPPPELTVEYRLLERSHHNILNVISVQSEFSLHCPRAS